MGEINKYITSTDENGGVSISQDVIAVIAGSAVLEVEGVASLHPVHSRDIAELVGKKGFVRSVRAVIEGDSVSLDVYIITESGAKVGRVGASVQKAVIEAIENSVGIKPTFVNVHISGISLKKNA
jgi:Uncharacterized protein conserved in bacteria